MSNNMSGWDLYKRKDLETEKILWMDEGNDQNDFGTN